MNCLEFLGLTNRSIGRVLAGVATSVAVIVTTPASAQFGELAGISEAMQPDYFKRDMTIIAQELNLDDTQRVIIDALFQDYEVAFKEGVDRARQRIENSRNEVDNTDLPAVLREVLRPLKEWGPEKQRLGEEFLENIKVVLNDEQNELWPPVARRLYRERKLAKGELAGESLDLFAVVREMHLDDRTAVQVQPIIDAYDIALDQALRRRELGDDQGAAVKDDMLDSISEQDNKKQLEALKRGVTLRVAVRNVNEQYLEQIAAAMPEDIAAKFRLAALERAYGRIYRETPVQRLFNDAKKIEGLDPGVLKSIEQLEVSYLTELAAMNEQIRVAQREFEPIESISKAESFHKRMEGQQAEPVIDPTRELFNKRDDLGRTYAKQLQGLLTAEQFAKLPGGQRWVDAPEESKPRAKPTGNDSNPKSKSRDRTDEGEPPALGTGDSSGANE